ncbi:MAG: hypothetical protein QME07_01780 [bacterium]|nr:hypothetical protein [bacterium]
MLAKNDTGFRKAFINILLGIGKKYQKGGTGSMISLLQEQSTKVWPDLKGILKEIDWAVIGGVGLRLYIPERQTQDLDIAINKKDEKEAKKRLKEAGFEYKGGLSCGGSCWLSPENVVIDVIECEEAWIDIVLKEAKKNRDYQGLPIIPFEYLILMKFTSARVQDIADITQMLGLCDTEKIERTRQVFRNQLLEGLEDLESLIYLSKLENERRQSLQ